MIEAIITKNKEFLEKAVEKRDIYFKGETSFTRQSKLGYQGVAINLINLPRRSMAVELEDYFEQVDMGVCACDKSTFSHARKKLRSIFFKDWYEDQNKRYYESFPYKTWEGFKLMGVDGTRFYLFNEEQVIAKYGTQRNQHGEKAMAQGLIGYDVLNGLCLFSDIQSVNKSETAMLLPWLDDISSDTLCLYDRLFPSAFLLYLHQEKQIPYLMRCKATFNQVVKDFVASDSVDELVNIKLTSKAIKQLKELGYPVTSKDSVRVRLVKVELDSGETEILITSLLDQQKYPTSLFKGLYAKRWGVETGIGQLKNQLQVEIFSGRSPLAIEQDFYASIFTYNLQSIFIRSLDEQVAQKNEGRQHDYQINRNVTLGILKGRMIRLFINPIDGLAEELRQKFINHLTEDRKDTGIKMARNKKIQRTKGKYCTHTNYKRAI
jgi:Transposase DDE domain.